MVDNFHNVDCMDFMQSLSSLSVDFTLTDIPYDMPVVADPTSGGKDYARLTFDFGKANQSTFMLEPFWIS